MKFAEYIELLSDSPLTRAKFDALLKKRGIIYEVEEGDEYDQAVMSGHFRGKRSEFQYTKPKKEQSIDAYRGFAKDILAEVTAKADKNHKHDIEDVNGLSAKFQDISKSIDDIDDKHTTKYISYEESQKKYQSEIQSLNDRVKKLYAKPDKDYSISDINGLSDNLMNIQTSIKQAEGKATKAINSKADKDHKHNIKDIDGLDKWSKTIKSDILDEIPTIDEVKDALDNVYIKSEVYNKEEVDSKLKKAVKSVYITETMGIGGGGGGTTGGGTRGSITGTLSDQADLQTALDGKANVVHTHIISDVTGLQTALDDKASITGTYTNPSWIASLAWAKVTGTPTTLSGYGITDGWKTTGNSGTTAGTNFIGTTDAIDFVVKTNGLEVMRVTSAGNVGIGTTTPTGRFTVSSGGGVNSGINLNMISSSSYGTIDFNTPSGLSGQFITTGSLYSNSIFAGDQLALASYIANGRTTLVAGGINGFINFATGGYSTTNERMRIDKNGNIGIGTISPTALIDAGGSSTSRSSLRIRSGTAPTTPNDGDIWYDGTDLKMRVGGVTKTFTLV